MGKFDGKVVLVTGAAGGIGKEFVKKVVDEGASVSLVDVNIEALKNVEKELGLSEERVLSVAADVSKEEDVKNYVEKTVDKFGKIDGFFNNAGVEGKYAPVEQYPTEVFDFVLNVNVRGVFLGLKYVIPVMKRQGKGTVVNTASVAGLMGAPGMIAYNTSKHAVIGMTRVVAAEVAEHGIRINALAPGVINTRMMRQIEENTSPGAAKEVEKAYAESVPMKRYGNPDEVANVALFLLSDDSSYVTSSIYTVHGGLLQQ
ncbi:SDR family NAD(P)-dependent oxidoreductase [Fervidibacillus albus]|uniref:SDR family oxidoreductase n=1 Tax=Fervidibacillus albus TaxID=2980026 RepID=A0A9E8LUH0_9BACI|nr:SDR family NAD(P)-dependent oxidoreductase [Fervidibacillus albus]WAA09741.1 SDR family oxidoreductase [Fervidibacillus albus]